MRKISYQKTFLFLLILVILWLLFYAYGIFFRPPSSNDMDLRFRVQAGDSVPLIAKKLKEQKLIRNQFAFLTLIELKNLDKKVRVGQFKLKRSMTPLQILKIITDPNQKEIVFLVKEGEAITDIDKKLFELGLIEKGDFIKCARDCNFAEYNFLPKNSLEGYLFPDTYFLEETTFSPENLTKRMLENFERKTGPFLPEIQKNKRTLNEIIIMASIIEKEVRTKDDYPIVSGILWKRFDAKWGLDADATLLYGEDTKIITPALLAKNSPYNTRKFRGLPPTSIANPGLATIRAALFPQTSPYWFYLTAQNGRVIYAKTNEEHEVNKKKYLGF